MSCEHMIWAHEQGAERKLKPPARLVLQALARRANQGGWTWPSQPLLASDTGLTVRSCHTWAHWLADVGLIALEQRGKLLHYRILMPAKGDETLQPLQGSESYEPPKDYQSMQEVHDKDYRPVQEVHGSAPRPMHAVQGDPCKSLQPTHARGASKYTKKEYTKPKTREDARKRVGFNSHLSKEAGTPPAEPEREPTPREVEARRREEAAAIAGMPSELARAVQSLGASMRGIAYAPGRTGISRDEQLATYEPRRPKAAPVSDEQLHAIRQLAARSLGRSPLAPGLSLVSR